VLDLTRFVLAKLGFDKFTAQISLRDPENKTKYIGTDENWRKAEQAIIDAAAEVGLNTVTALGEAAFTARNSTSW
jgi:threonyl-tRNA synthetase